MPLGSLRSAVTLEELCSTCEKLYERDGFVKWSDVAKVYGLSRQAVHNRLKAAVEKQELDEALFQRWASPTSRAAASRKNRDLSRERDKLVIRTTLTESNLKWLREQCVVRGVTSADVINGLINKAREA